MVGEALKYIAWLINCYFYKPPKRVETGRTMKS